MKPATPVLQGFHVPEIPIAEGQDQYQTLPAVITKDGLVLTRWEITPDERRGLITGAKHLFMFVWLGMCHSCGVRQQLSPMLPEVTTAQEIMTRAAGQVQREAMSPNGHPIQKAEGGPAEGSLLAQLEDKTPAAPEAEGDPLKELFKELWESQIGRPGYRERRWREFRELLKGRGVEV